MTLLVAGAIRVPPQNLADFRQHMLAMLTATRAEDGCLDYSYAEDVAEPGLIRVFEAWRDEAALAAHFKAPHLDAWRASWPKYGVGERRLIAYDIAAQRDV